MTRRVASTAAGRPRTAVARGRRASAAAVVVLSWIGVLGSCSSGDDGAGAEGASADPQSPPAACERLTDEPAGEGLGATVSGEPVGPGGDEVAARCEWERLASCQDAAGEEANPTDAVGDGRHPLVETGMRAGWSSPDGRDAEAQARQLAPLAEVGVIVQAQAGEVLVTILDDVPDPDPELGCYSDVLSLAGWERHSVASVDVVAYGRRLDVAGVAAEVPGELGESDARQICERARDEGAVGCVAGTSDRGDGSLAVVQLFGVDSTNPATYLEGLLPPGTADSPDLHLAAISTTAIPAEG